MARKKFGCVDTGLEEKIFGGCEICDPPTRTRITPSGTYKSPGLLRIYISGDKKHELTREDYNAWAISQGAPKTYDVASVWFIEMGHGPVPDDVKL